MTRTVCEYKTSQCISVRVNQQFQRPKLHVAWIIEFCFVHLSLFLALSLSVPHYSSLNSLNNDTFGTATKINGNKTDMYWLGGCTLYTVQLYIGTWEMEASRVDMKCRNRYHWWTFCAYRNDETFTNNNGC